ncbi:hypothetical protein ACIOJE_13115 [Kitasatospora sp. NPDC087861]|uniref:hypothetical protein n=1 Tax=Kitasatospora sp. NPDC087861 TaxID=3364070 RepID=UPI003802439C
MAQAQIPQLHGYGVRWDPEGRCYRVRNETTGEWLHQSSGELSGFSSFSAAYSAWRGFEARRRVGA